MKGTINDLRDNRLFYDLDTNEGQSGSAISIRTKSGGHYAIGIHTHGTNDPVVGNSGVYLSQEKFDQIIQWISESSTIRNTNPSPLFTSLTFISQPSSTAWETAFDSHKNSNIKEFEKDFLCDQWENEQERLRNLQSKFENKSRYEKDWWRSNTEKRTEQIKKMQNQGIFVSEDMNSAGNFALLRDQIEAKKNALEQANTYIQTIQKPSDTVLEYIGKFNTSYTSINQPVDWKNAGGQYNEKLSFYNPGRYESCFWKTRREKEIKKSKKSSIPLDIKLTTTANLMRQEKIIKKEDKVIWKAFEVGAHLRSDEVEAENARLWAVIASHGIDPSAIGH